MLSDESDFYGTNPNPEVEVILEKFRHHLVQFLFTQVKMNHSRSLLIHSSSLHLDLLQIIDLLIMLLLSSTIFFVIKHLIIKCELKTMIRSIIGVCFSIDIIEVIPRSNSVHVFIRMNLERP
jgi:hypothetical protein